MKDKVLKISKRYHTSDGLWIGPVDYKVKINGEEHDYRDLAKEYGIVPPMETTPWEDTPTKPTSPSAPIKPNKKKQINTDIEEKSYGDLEQTHDSASAEEYGDGDSESTE